MYFKILDSLWFCFMTKAAGICGFFTDKAGEIVPSPLKPTHLAKCEIVRALFLSNKSENETFAIMQRAIRGCSRYSGKECADMMNRRSFPALRVSRRSALVWRPLGNDPGWIL